MLDRYKSILFFATAVAVAMLHYTSAIQGSFSADAVHDEDLLYNVFIISANHGTAQQLVNAGLSGNKIIDGRTILQFAAWHGWTDIVHTLLIEGADPNIKNCDGESPLSEATRFNHIDVVRTLLAHGARVNERCADEAGDIPFDDATPLILAAQEGKVEMVRLLLDRGADIRLVACEWREPQISGFTALLAAARAGHWPVVMTLLERGDNVNAQTSNGMNAALYAIAQNKPDQLKRMVRNFTAHVPTQATLQGCSAYTQASDVEKHRMETFLNDLTKSMKAAPGRVN